MPIYELQALNAGVLHAHSRLVKADTQAQALLWLIANDAQFAEPVNIYARQVDVVDLTKASEPGVVNASESVAAIIKAARDARFLPDEDNDTLNTAQAAELTGLSAAGIHNRKYRGIFQSAGRGLITRASVQAWLDKGGRESEKRDTASIVKRMNEARAAKRANANGKGQGKEEKAKPVKPEPEEDMVREEKLAKELGMELVELRTLKREGGVEGGFGWVDRIGFERYLKTK